MALLHAPAYPYGRLDEAGAPWPIAEPSAFLPCGSPAGAHFRAGGGPVPAMPRGRLVQAASPLEATFGGPRLHHDVFEDMDAFALSPAEPVATGACGGGSSSSRAGAPQSPWGSSRRGVFEQESDFELQLRLNRRMTSFGSLECSWLAKNAFAAWRSLQRTSASMQAATRGELAPPVALAAANLQHIAELQRTLVAKDALILQLQHQLVQLAADEAAVRRRHAVRASERTREMGLGAEEVLLLRWAFAHFEHVLIAARASAYAAELEGRLRACDERIAMFPLQASKHRRHGVVHATESVQRWAACGEETALLRWAFADLRHAAREGGLQRQAEALEERFLEVEALVPRLEARLRRREAALNAASCGGAAAAEAAERETELMLRWAFTSFAHAAAESMMQRILAEQQQRFAGIEGQLRRREVALEVADRGAAEASNREAEVLLRWGFSSFHWFVEEARSEERLREAEVAAAEQQQTLCRFEAASREVEQSLLEAEQKALQAEAMARQFEQQASEVGAWEERALHAEQRARQCREQVAELEAWQRRAVQCETLLARAEAHIRAHELAHSDMARSVDFATTHFTFSAWRRRAERRRGGRRAALLAAQGETRLWLAGMLAAWHEACCLSRVEVAEGIAREASEAAASHAEQAAQEAELRARLGAIDLTLAQWAKGRVEGALIASVRAWADLCRLQRARSRTRAALELQVLRWASGDDAALLGAALGAWLRAAESARCSGALAAHASLSEVLRRRSCEIVGRHTCRGLERLLLARALATWSRHSRASRLARKAAERLASAGSTALEELVLAQWRAAVDALRRQGLADDAREGLLGALRRRGEDLTNWHMSKGVAQALADEIFCRWLHVSRRLVAGRRAAFAFARGYHEALSGAAFSAWQWAVAAEARSRAALELEAARGKLQARATRAAFAFAGKEDHCMLQVVFSEWASLWRDAAQMTHLRRVYARGCGIAELQAGRGYDRSLLVRVVAAWATTLQARRFAHMAGFALARSCDHASTAEFFSVWWHIVVDSQRARASEQVASVRQLLEEWQDGARNELQRAAFLIRDRALGAAEQSHAARDAAERRHLALLVLLAFGASVRESRLGAQVHAAQDDAFRQQQACCALDAVARDLNERLLRAQESSGLQLATMHEQRESQRCRLKARCAQAVLGLERNNSKALLDAMFLTWRQASLVGRADRIKESHDLMALALEERGLAMVAWHERVGARRVQLARALSSWAACARTAALSRQVCMGFAEKSDGAVVELVFAEWARALRAARLAAATDGARAAFATHLHMRGSRLAEWHACRGVGRVFCLRVLHAWARLREFFATARKSAATLAVGTASARVGLVFHSWRHLQVQTRKCALAETVSKLEARSHEVELALASRGSSRAIVTRFFVAWARKRRAWHIARACALSSARSCSSALARSVFSLWQHIVEGLRRDNMAQFQSMANAACEALLQHLHLRGCRLAEWHCKRGLAKATLSRGFTAWSRAHKASAFAKKAAFVLVDGDRAAMLGTCVASWRQAVLRDVAEARLQESQAHFEDGLREAWNRTQTIEVQRRVLTEMATLATAALHAWARVRERAAWRKRLLSRGLCLSAALEGAGALALLGVIVAKWAQACTLGRHTFARAACQELLDALERRGQQLMDWHLRKGADRVALASAMSAWSLVARRGGSSRRLALRLVLEQGRLAAGPLLGAWRRVVESSRYQAAGQGACMALLDRLRLRSARLVEWHCVRGMWCSLLVKILARWAQARKVSKTTRQMALTLAAASDVRFLGITFAGWQAAGDAARRKRLGEDAQSRLRARGAKAAFMLEASCERAMLGTVIDAWLRVLKDQAMQAASMELIDEAVQRGNGILEWHRSRDAEHLAGRLFVAWWHLMQQRSAVRRTAAALAGDPPATLLASVFVQWRHVRQRSVRLALEGSRQELQEKLFGRGGRAALALVGQRGKEVLRVVFFEWRLLEARGRTQRENGALEFKFHKMGSCFASSSMKGSGRVLRAQCFLGWARLRHAALVSQRAAGAFARTSSRALRRAILTSWASAVALARHVRTSSLIERMRFREDAAASRIQEAARSQVARWLLGSVLVRWRRMAAASRAVGRFGGLYASAADAFRMRWLLAEWHLIARGSCWKRKQQDMAALLAQSSAELVQAGRREVQRSRTESTARRTVRRLCMSIDALEGHWFMLRILTAWARTLPSQREQRRDGESTTRLTDVVSKWKTSSADEVDARSSRSRSSRLRQSRERNLQSTALIEWANLASSRRPQGLQRYGPHASRRSTPASPLGGLPTPSPQPLAGVVAVGDDSVTLLSPSEPTSGVAPGPTTPPRHGAAPRAVTAATWARFAPPARPGAAPWCVPPAGLPGGAPAECAASAARALETAMSRFGTQLSSAPEAPSAASPRSPPAPSEPLQRLASEAAAVATPPQRRSSSLLGAVGILGARAPAARRVRHIMFDTDVSTDAPGAPRAPTRTPSAPALWRRPA